MAWAPFAIHKNIAPGSNDPAIDVIGAILHVAVSESDSLFPYFNGPSNGIESHFYIRYDGTIEQYRDTGYEADANYKANSFYSGGRRYGFVSIETEGMGRGKWTAAQMAAIRRLLAWLSETHDFPLRKCPGPYAPGVGYHTLFDGHWTPYDKTCPGVDRIPQFDNELVPWMARGGRVDDLTEEESDQLAFVYGRLKGVTDQDYIVEADGKRRAAKILDERDGNYLVGRIGRIEAALTALAQGMGGTVKAAMLEALSEKIEVEVRVTAGNSEPTP